MGLYSLTGSNNCSLIGSRMQSLHNDSKFEKRKYYKPDKVPHTLVQCVKYCVDQTSKFRCESKSSSTTLTSRGTHLQTRIKAVSPCSGQTWPKVLHPQCVLQLHSSVLPCLRLHHMLVQHIVPREVMLTIEHP